METPPPNQPPSQDPVQPIGNPVPQPHPMYSPAASKIRFEVIGQAFNMVFADLGTWAVAGVFMLLAIGVAYILMWVLLAGALFSGSFILMMLMFAVMIFVVMAVGMVMMSNMYRMAIIALSGTKPSVNEMFKFGGNLPNIFTAALLVAICTAVASCFFYIPGWIVGGLLMFTMPLVVDRNMPAVDAMKLSVETLKNDIVMATLFYLVIGLCAGIGAVACGIGIVFTIPVLPLAIAMLYRDHFGFTSVAPEPAVAT
jgi:uncharacterized membrane protein